MIETRGLTQRYGQLTALDSLDLKVESGELYGFIGPNGAGKTTTIQILATLLKPTEGDAWVAGHDVRFEGREVRRRIGYMPDFFGLYQSLRLEEYLEFFAAAYEVPPARRKTIVADVLELTDLTVKRDAVVGSLSRGMQQRLGLARVLIHDPEVLLLDEPASGLDPRARMEVREILRELRTMGKTILLSSHILSELADLCTSIGILHGGRLVTSGPVDQVLAEVGGARPVRVTLEATAEAAVAALDELPAVERLEVVGAAGAPASDTNPTTVRATLRDGAGAPEVAAFLVGRGLRLLHLETEKMALEDAYLHLTSGES